MTALPKEKMSVKLAFLAWAWLAKAKGHSCHTKKSTLAKKRPVKITMYMCLDIIIKLKFTTNFDRCAILNILNYLTKDFES